MIKIFTIQWRYTLLCSWMLLATVDLIQAQTNSGNPQVICEGIQRDYQVDYTEGAGAGTPGSTYTWAVPTTGFLGNITTNQGPSGSSNRVRIDWAATPPGTYVLQVTETNGSCPGDVTTLNVIINAVLTPTFDPVGPFCLNSTPPALPGTSKDGITGTWSPTVINTSSTGSSVYTFTPDPGQCAGPTTLSVSINDATVPVLDPIAPLCLNSTPPVLPVTSTNGISGSWTPATISTAAAGVSTYTFTPDPAQCAVSTTLDITVNDLPAVQVTGPVPICEGQSTGLTATGANTYTWTPSAGLSATSGSTVTATPAATTTYTVTGTDVNGCVNSDDITVTLTPIPVTSPIYHD